MQIPTDATPSVKASIKQLIEEIQRLRKEIEELKRKTRGI